MGKREKQEKWQSPSAEHELYCFSLRQQKLSAQRRDFRDQPSCESSPRRALLPLSHEPGSQCAALGPHSGHHLLLCARAPDMVQYKLVYTVTPVERQASCPLPGDLSSAGELSLTPSDSPENSLSCSFSIQATLLITIPPLTPGKKVLYRGLLQRGWFGAFSDGFFLCCRAFVYLFD